MVYWLDKFSWHPQCQLEKQKRKCITCIRNRQKQSITNPVHNFSVQGMRKPDALHHLPEFIQKLFHMTKYVSNVPFVILPCFILHYPFLLLLCALLQTKLSHLNSTTRITEKGISESQSKEVKQVTGYPLVWTQTAQNRSIQLSVSLILSLRCWQLGYKSPAERLWSQRTYYTLPAQPIRTSSCSQSHFTRTGVFMEGY